MTLRYDCLFFVKYLALDLTMHEGSLESAIENVMSEIDILVS